jgi:prepilin-type N-terminal cleavage/methylation domain-containing protein
MRNDKDRCGFTLIEVMAAAVILGLIVATISPLLMQARTDEGDARRRASAAMLAERLIVEAEEAIARGAPPQIGTRELSEEILRATVETKPLDASALEGVAAQVAEADARAASPVGTGGGWLTSPQARATPPVLQIAVRVTWEGAPVDADSGDPHAVQRTTFALNPAALATLEKSETDGGEEGDE